MNTLFHSADSRGSADHGWLKAKHSFSFGGWFNTDRIQFGALRVLNDDVIQGGKGFGAHPHNNMEIITIPLHGDLEHKDSIGNSEVIREGEIQVMSAGTGVSHSEYTKDPDREISLLQLWIFPNKKNVTPRYDQIPLNTLYKKNEPFQILSPNPHDQGVWIHQNAWLHILDFEEEKSVYYDLKAEGNGVYVFVIDGEVEIGEVILNKRDALGITETATFELIAHQDAKVLLIEVPMDLQ
jgi:hypothetical protein